MQVERYLGEQREPAGRAAEPMSPHDERRWSVVAHLSVLAGLVGLAPFGAFVLAVAPLAHWCYADYRVNGGVDYRYPYIADRIDGCPRRVF